MFETRTGNTLSSHSSEAAGLYQEAVDLILGSESGAAETLDRALEGTSNNPWISILNDTIRHLCVEDLRNSLLLRAIFALI